MNRQLKEKELWIAVKNMKHAQPYSYKRKCKLKVLHHTMLLRMGQLWNINTNQLKKYKKKPKFSAAYELTIFEIKDIYVYMHCPGCHQIDTATSGRASRRLRGGLEELFILFKSLKKFLLLVQQSIQNN